jgi:hypothetical protein
MNPKRAEHLDLRRMKWQETGEDCVTRNFRTLHFTIIIIIIIIVVIMSRSRWAGHAARIGEMRKPEGKRPLGRPMRRW